MLSRSKYGVGESSSRWGKTDNIPPDVHHGAALSDPADMLIKANFPIHTLIVWRR